MDWQLCSKPVSVRPQDLCELNVNAVLVMLCKSIERMDGWMIERKTEERRRKRRGRKEDGNGPEKRIDITSVPFKTEPY